MIELAQSQLRVQGPEMEGSAQRIDVPADAKFEAREYLTLDSGVSDFRHLDDWVS